MRKGLPPFSASCGKPNSASQHCWPSWNKTGSKVMTVRPRLDHFDRMLTRLHTGGFIDDEARPLPVARKSGQVL